MDENLTQERIQESTRSGLWRNESLETYLDRWATGSGTRGSGPLHGGSGAASFQPSRSTVGA